MINTKFYKEELINSLRTGRHPADNVVLKDNTNTSGTTDYPVDNALLNKNNLFRNIAKIITLVKYDGDIRVGTSDSIAEFIDERAEFSSDEPIFNPQKYTAYKVGKIIKVKEDILSDNAELFESYLDEETAKSIGKAEEKAVINGLGNNIEPKGLLKLDLGGVTATALTYDSIVDLYFSLDKDYRSNACFVMSDTTAMAIRKMVDSSGNPIWNQANDTIFGKKVYISNYMPDDKPILFGDFSYLWIIYREGIKVRRLGELFIDQCYIAFVVSERLDFKLTQTNAVKVLSIQEVETSQE